MLDLHNLSTNDLLTETIQLRAMRYAINDLLQHFDENDCDSVSSILGAIHNYKEEINDRLEW